LRSVFVNSPPPKPEVILTNFFAEPTVLLVPITSRVYFPQKTQIIWLSNILALSISGDGYSRNAWYAQSIISSPGIYGATILI